MFWSKCIIIHLQHIKKLKHNLLPLYDCYCFRLLHIRTISFTTDTQSMLAAAVGLAGAMLTKKFDCVIHGTDTQLRKQGKFWETDHPDYANSVTGPAPKVWQTYGYKKGTVLIQMFGTILSQLARSSQSLSSQFSLSIYFIEIGPNNKLLYGFLYTQCCREVPSPSIYKTLFTITRKERMEFTSMENDIFMKEVLVNSYLGS